MKKQASDERELFQRLRQADPGALDSFYSLYSNSIYLFAYRLLDNVSDAEDVTSSAFAMLWKEKEVLESAVHVKNFLFNVAKNESISLLRKRKVSAVTMKDLSRKKDISPYPADMKLLRSEIVAEIFKEVAKLPSKRMQDVFVLRFIEQKEPVEIAEMMQLPVKTVYNDTEYARKRIRTLLINKGLDLTYMLVILSLSIGTVTPSPF